MTRNAGSVDRILRLAAGVFMLAVALYGPGSGLDWIGWLGVVPLLTGLTGWCPAYALTGIGTRRRGI